MPDNKHTTLTSLLGDIADEIRLKSTGSKIGDALKADDFDTYIHNLQTPADGLENATVTSGAGSATIGDPSYNSTGDNFVLTATGTVGAPTVGTDGYISSTRGTKNGNTVSGSKTLGKVTTGVDITGDSTKKPSISKTAKPSGDSWIDAAGGAATTTKPTTAVPYIRVDSSANTGTLTATPKVTSAGYGDTSHYGATAGTATVGALASDPTYIPIATGSVSNPTATKGTVSNHSITVTPKVTSSTGWITGQTNQTGTAVTVSASELVSGNKSLTSSASAQNNIDVTNYATVSVAAIPASAIDNSIISGSAYEESTDDYAWKTTVTIPAGYHTAQTLEKTFSTVFPAPESEALASQVLVGYELFDHDGKKITGTMPNNTTGGTISTQGGTYAIPAGYTPGGTVTANINAGSHSGTVSTHNISTTPVVTPSIGGTVTDISSTSQPSGTSGTDYWTLDPGGSVTTTGVSTAKATATIGTAGYISTSSSESAAHTVNITPTVAAGTNRYISKATSSKTNPTSSATNGTASITKNPSASASVTATGFTPLASGTSAYYVTASASSASGTISATGGSASTTAGSVTVGAGYNPSSVTASVAASSASGTSASTTEKTASDSKTIYIPAGTHSGTVSTHSISTTPVVTPSIGGTSTDISSTTKPSGTDGTDYWTLDPGGSVTTTGVSSAKATATIGTAGYIASSSGESSAHTVNITPTVAAGTNRYISKATSSTTQPTASATNGTASVTKQPSASASTSVTGMVTTSTDTGYSVSASASSGSGTISATGGSASTTAGSVTVGAGYNPSSVTVSVSAKSASGTSASTTEVTKSASNTKYIQKGVLSASVSSNSGGSASMSATGFTASSSATSYYVTLSTSAGSVKAKASVGTEGYVKTETNETASTAVAVSGNGNKLYIPAGSAGTPTASKGTVSNNQVTVTPSVTNTTGYIAGSTKTGTGVTVSASELVSGNKSLSPSDSAQSNIDVTNYATASVSAITYSAAPTITLGYGTLSASTSKGRYKAGSSNVTIGLGSGTSQLTAAAAHILSGKRAIGTNAAGNAVASVTGTMTNNGAGSSTTLDSTTTSKTIAAGYWSSANTVSISVATLAQTKAAVGLS